MLLEKFDFIEKSVDVTIDEVIEEAELILEGSDPKASATLIISIMNQLRDVLNKGDFPKEEEKEGDHTSCDEDLLPGCFIKLKEKKCPFGAIPDFFPVCGFEKDERFNVSIHDRHNFKGGTIVSKFVIPIDSIADEKGEFCYIAEKEGKLYFVLESTIVGK